MPNRVSLASKSVPRHHTVPLCNQQHGKPDYNPICYNIATMFDLFRFCFGVVLRIFRDRRSLLLENLTLRQQLTVLKRKHPRPRLGPLDRLFWVVVRQLWS